MGQSLQHKPRDNSIHLYSRIRPPSSFPNFPVLDEILIYIHICAGDLTNLLLFPSQAVRWGLGVGVGVQRSGAEHQGKETENVVGKVRREKKKEKLHPVSIFHT